MTLARKRSPRTPPPTEEAEQRFLAQCLDMAGLLWAAVPNGARTSWSQAKRLKAQGLKAGVPDIMVFSVPPARPNLRGVAIELKRQRGGRVSKEQAEWHRWLEKEGWFVEVCRGAREALTTLRWLGYRVPEIS